jgi:hypothetical protein
MTSKMLITLKVLAALVGAVAFVIPFFALGDAYERERTSEPRDARVIEVTDGVVHFEVHDPGSDWDEDGDGWIGPFSDENVPSDALAALRPGARTVERMGKLEASITPPSPLLLAGAVLCLLLAAAMIVTFVRELREVAAAASQPMRLIEVMLRKTRRAKITAAVLLFGAGLGICAVTILAGEGLGQQIFLGLLGVVSLAFAAYVALEAWKLRDLANAPVLRAIQDEPNRIVWIYTQETRVNGIASFIVFLCRDDGARYEFNLVEHDPEPLVASLASMLPHAVVGYTPERLDAWSRSPASLAA